MDHTLLRIKSIKRVESTHHVYDLHVPKNNCFFIGAQPVLTHNCDGMSAQGQQALRGFIEEFSKNHSVILTANFAAKIIDPIRSRCKVIRSEERRVGKECRL